MLKVLIVGAGRIGAFFDEPGSKFKLSHAHALKTSDNFELIGFVDVDENKSILASKVWKCEGFKTIDEAFKKFDIDLVCVTNPDEFHFNTLVELSGYPLKAIFCEKPLTKTILEAKQIFDIYHRTGVLISVNYSRRFVPEFIELKSRISVGDFGNFVTGSGFYGKGILHNGSHMIDLLQFLIGELDSFNILGYSYDYKFDDPSVSCQLKFKNAKYFVLHSIDHRDFTVFEAELFFEKGRVSIKDSGSRIIYYKPEESKLFKDYIYLRIDQEVETSLYDSLPCALKNIWDSLSDSSLQLSPLNESFKTLAFCNQIVDFVQGSDCSDLAQN